MWAWFKSKIFIRSLKALEKSAAEKMGSEKKNGFFKLPLSKPNQKKSSILF
jgi:hypothetical protein